MYVECMWSVSGVYVECIWSVSGVYLECIWSGRAMIRLINHNASKYKLGYKSVPSLMCIRSAISVYNMRSRL